MKEIDLTSNERIPVYYAYSMLLIRVIITIDLRSRTKIPRPEDTAAGERYLRSIGYPHMNRFIDRKMEMGIF